ncbi:ABC transporter permease [Ferrovibrio sp.]|uniref:ABC transporter permease n=1 Tax=Ferrovibrio sp. TaxID=1917215 RepID=UPI00311D94AD
MAIRIEKRAAASLPLLYATPLLALGLTLLAGVVLFLALGVDAGAALYHIFIEPFETLSSIGEVLIKAAPLVMIGIGLAIGFRANVWNIGAEGQLTLGAVASGGVALAFWHETGVWIFPLMVLAGILGGMAWAAIPAFLKARFNVNEILTSLMLTYVAALFLSTLVYGPWKDPQGFNFPQSRMFNDSETLSLLVEGTRIHAGVPAAIVIALLAYVLLERTVTGFEIRVAGLAPAAARHAGFRENRLVWLSFLVSGGLAGLAGTLEVAGPIGQLVPVITPGYGFTAIIVAFLGRLHPIGILASGLLMALTYVGGENAQIAVGLPRAATGMFQGLLLFFLLATDFLARYRVRIAARAEARP